MLDLRCAMVLMTSLAAVAGAVHAAERVPIRFNVPDGLGAYSGEQPVTFGVPFAKGTLRKRDGVRVVDTQGRPVPAQIEVTATWGPKSDEVRWLLVDTAARIEKGQAQPRFLEFGPDVPRNVVPEMQLAGLDTFIRDYARVTLTDGAGNAYKPLRLKAVVERAGPTRSVVKITGDFEKADGSPLAKLIVRVRFFARMSRVFVTLIWLTDDRTEIGELAYEVAKGRGLATHIGIDGKSVTVGPKVKRVLQTDWDRVGGDLAGKQLDGWLSGSVFCGLRWPWQQFPVGFDVSDDRLAVLLIGPEKPMSLRWNDIAVDAVKPRQMNRKDPRVVDGVVHNWWDVWTPGRSDRLISPRGISKTWELLVWFGDDGVKPQVKNILCQHPVLATADPAFATEANLPSPMTPRDAKRFPLIEGALDRAFDWYTMERNRDGDYGTWNYGDLQWIWTGYGYTVYRYWMNNGKGWPIMPWILWMRSGARKYHENGEANARHLMDVDTCHVPEWERAADGKIRGGIYEYSAMHWSKGPPVDYFTADTEYLPYYYYLTGYERAWDVLQERVEALKRYDRKQRAEAYRKDRLSRTRTLYVMIKELAVLYEATWDPELKAYLDEYIKLVLDGQGEEGWFPGIKSNHYLDQGLNLAMRVYGPDRILPALEKWHRFLGDWDRPGTTGEMTAPLSLWTAVTVSKHRNDPRLLSIAAACARARVWNIDDGASSWRGMALVPAHEAGPFLRDWVTVMAALSERKEGDKSGVLAPAHINARLPIAGADAKTWRGRHVVLVLDEKGDAFKTHFGFLCMNFGVLTETPQLVRVIAPDGSVVSEKTYPIKVSYNRQLGRHNITVDVPADGKKGVYLFEMFTRPLALPTLARSSTGKVVHFVPPGRRSFTTAQGGWCGGGVVWFQPKGGEEVFVSYPNNLAGSRTVILDSAGKLVASSRITGTHEKGRPVGEPCRFRPEKGDTGLYAFNASSMDWHRAQEIGGMRPYMAHFKEEWFDPTQYPCPDLKPFLPKPGVQASPRPTPTNVPFPKGKNILANGDFEAGEAGPETRGKFPPGWTRPFGSPARVEIVKETRPGSTGKQCLRIAPAATPPQSGVYSQLTPFDPTKPLGISGWVKSAALKSGNKGYNYFGIGWYDAQRKPALINKKTKQNYYYLGAPRNGKWYHSRAVYTRAAEAKDVYAYTEYPPNAAFFDIRCFVIGYDKDAATYDDIQAMQ